MAEKISKIFGVKKVTFNEPGESYEQDCIFLTVQSCQSRTGKGRATARVSGSMTIFSQLDKLPYGFFNKRVQNADPELTRDFFFFDIDVDALNSPARLQGIAERRAGFVYYYAAQYDPNHGELKGFEFKD